MTAKRRKEIASGSRLSSFFRSRSDTILAGPPFVSGSTDFNFGKASTLASRRTSRQYFEIRRTFASYVGGLRLWQKGMCAPTATIVIDPALFCWIARGLCVEALPDEVYGRPSGCGCGAASAASGRSGRGRTGRSVTSKGQHAVQTDVASSSPDRNPNRFTSTPAASWTGRR
jgi:hypothetical protein